MPVVIFIGFAVLCIYLADEQASVADFMILAEGEMKKVNWSTRHEMSVSTWW